jgi:hypothetical protein
MSQFWETRIYNANKYYSEWATKFKCDILEKYYEGEQWKGRRDFVTVNYNPYMLNLVYSTIKVKLAGLVFQKPAFLISPKPGGQDWSADQAMQSAGIKQDMLNTVIQNPNANFASNIKKAARDSFFRFGIIEVGYAADWRNPQKEDPLLSDYGKEPKDNARVVEDNLVPVNERFYFKRINPKRFRVSVSDADELNDHEWCGYYDFYYTKTLKKTKGIKWPEEYQNVIVSADFTDTNLFSGGENKAKPDFLRLLSEGEISKVWHIWDLVEKKRLLLLDDNFEILWEGDCDRLPLYDLRWDLRFEGYYPLPPVFQWLTPQDEINEAREQMRSFRRRFTRKFYYIKGMIDPLELEKFVSGPDGVTVEFKQEGALGEIPSAPINATTEQSLEVAMSDFNTISGTSPEARDQPDRGTATAAKITQQIAQIRDSADQLDFSDWMCLIARGTLVTAKESLVEGLWMKYTTSPDQASALQDIKVTGPAYKYITSQQIDDGYDFDIDVDVMNQTPAAMQAQQQAFITFVSLLQQFPQLAMSPVLIRKAALVSGMRDERVIQQMQQVAIATMAAKAQQAQLQASAQGQSSTSQVAPGGPGGPGGQNGPNVANATVAQQQTPTIQETQNQLQNQLVQ